MLIGKYVQLEPLQENHRQVLKVLAKDEKISIYSQTFFWFLGLSIAGHFI